MTSTFRELQQLLHRGGTMGYWWTTPNKRSTWWPVGEPAPIPSGRQNVYFGVHPVAEIPKTNREGKRVEPVYARSQNAGIAAVNCLFAEFDDKDFGGDHAAVREHVETQLAAPPSYVIDSGGGYHCYWPYDEPWLLDSEETREQARELQERWVAFVGADEVKDLARVLRVPGTLNIKYVPPRPVELIRAWPDVRYRRSDLERLMPPVLVDTTQTTAPLPVITPATDRERRYVLRALEEEAKKVAQWPDGFKHERLLDSAIAMGGFVRPGLLSFDEVFDALYTAIAPRAKDKRNAANTIRDGIRYGSVESKQRAIPEPTYSANSANYAKTRKAGSSRENGHSANSANSANEVEPWAKPIPFGGGDRPLFPVDALPSWLRDTVAAEAEATQTPLDLAAMLGLAVLSTACAGAVEVEVRPGWSEPVNIFAVVSLPPASRKSAVFAFMTRPLVEHELLEVAAAKAKVAEHENERVIKEAALARKRTEAARAEGAEADIRRDEAAELARELADWTPMAVPRYVVDDITPETLATYLFEQQGRIAVLGAEADVFDIMAGRYAGASGPNFGVYLKGHAGDTLRIDRKGRPPEFVARPALTVGVTVQPDALRGLTDKPGFRGRGLLGRFLYACPVPTLGRRRVDAAPVPPPLCELYGESLKTLFKNIYIYLNPAYGPVRLTLDTGASSLLRGFEEWLEPQLAEDGELGAMTDWAGKLLGATARLAALLHVAEYFRTDAWRSPISEHTVAAALQIAAYLIPHARLAYGEMGADPEIADAERILAWIEQRAAPAFTKREAFEALKGRFPKAAMLDAPLELLIERGYIRDVSPERPGPGRKPSPQYEVNPAILSSHNSHNSQNGAARMPDAGDRSSQYSHYSPNGDVRTAA